MKKESKYRRPALIAMLGVILLLLIEDVVLTRNAQENFKPILGLRLYGKNISSLATQDLKLYLQTKNFAAGPGIDFMYQGRVFHVSPLEAGALLNPDQLAGGLLAYGRTGTFFQNLWQQNRALLGLESKKISAGLSKPAITEVASAIGAAVYEDPTPPSPDFIQDIQKTLPGIEGAKIDASAFIQVVAENIFNPRGKKLSLPIIHFASSHDLAELAPLRAQALNLTEEPIQISSADVIFTLSPENLHSLLRVVERPDIKNPKETRLVLRLDDKALNQALGSFAESVQSVTHAEFDDHDARVAIYSQFYSGTRATIAIPTGSNLNYQAFLPRTFSRLTASIGEAAQIAQETNQEKFVYLTFDDGPNDVYHPQILDILKKYNVPATFFLVGQNSQKYKEIAQRTLAEGHHIGDHSLTHAFLPKEKPEVILKEIKTAKEIIHSVTGEDIVLFRPPYGGVNSSVTKDAKDLNLKLFLWDVDPRDWSDPSAEELVNRVISKIHPNADILLHSNHMVTVQALPQIIEQLQTLGYAFHQF